MFDDFGLMSTSVRHTLYKGFLPLNILNIISCITNNRS